MLAQVFGCPCALRHQLGDLVERGGVLLQKGEIGGAAADGVEKVQQAQQGGIGVGAMGGGFYHAGDDGIKARLGLGGELAVFAALADVGKAFGDAGAVGVAQRG